MSIEQHHVGESLAVSRARARIASGFYDDPVRKDIGLSRLCSRVKTLVTLEQRQDSEGVQTTITEHDSNGLA